MCPVECFKKNWISWHREVEGTLRKVLRVKWLIIGAFWMTLCLSPYFASAAPLTVAVSIAPQRFLVEGIGGDAVKVFTVVPPGSEPHSYEPSPKEMRFFSEADVYFTVGICMERVWVDKFMGVNPGLRVIPMDKGVDRIFLPHGGYDPHVWLSTKNMRIMAANTLNSLVKLDPSHKDQFLAGYKRVIERIDRVEKILKGELARCRGRAFVAEHPAWGYFAREFGMVQLAVEKEGRRPTTRELLELVNKAKSLNTKVVLIEPQFSDRAAKVVANEIGGKVVKSDPLSPKWDTVMLQLGRVLSKLCQ